MDQIQFDSRFRSRVLMALQKAIVENFQEHDWKEFGYATGHQDFIRSHKRLLRSLSWQDEDYGSCVFDFLEYLINQDMAALYKMVEHHKLRPYLEKHSLDVLSELGLSESHVPALPLPQISASEVVRRALADAESLLVSNGATSAVDRLHTALHGYLRSACADAGIAVAADASITALLKTLKSEHPGIKELGVHSAELVKVLNSFGNIVDALNTLRNHASVAHANENLLEQDEALLIVNAVRTLFNYLVKKLG